MRRSLRRAPVLTAVTCGGSVRANRPCSRAELRCQAGLARLRDTTTSDSNLVTDSVKFRRPSPGARHPPEKAELSHPSDRSPMTIDLHRINGGVPRPSGTSWRARARAIGVTPPSFACNLNGQITGTAGIGPAPIYNPLQGQSDGAALAEEPGLQPACRLDRPVVRGRAGRSADSRPWSGGAVDGRPEPALPGTLRARRSRARSPLRKLRAPRVENCSPRGSSLPGTPSRRNWLRPPARVDCSSRAPIMTC